MYTDYVQLLSHCSLTLLASSFSSESVVVVFSLFSPSFSQCVLSSFIFGLLAISYSLVSLPDLGSHFAFLLSSALVYIPMLCHW